MEPVLAIAKALSDQTRVRALLALRGGELCLCQLVDLLDMAPSTVSRHMDLLHQAGLVERRKEGRWHYFRLRRRSATPTVRKALRWALDHPADDPRVRSDDKRLQRIRRKDLQELSACYRGS